MAAPRRTTTDKAAVMHVMVEAASDVLLDHIERHKRKLQDAILKELRTRGLEPVLVTRAEAIEASHKIDAMAGKWFADQFLHALSR